MDEKAMLELAYIGEDFWSRPVYEDQYGKLWKDLDLGDSKWPSLHSSVGNDFEGEPLSPIRQEFIIRKARPSNKYRFEYMMLDRLRTDCEYYLGYGNRNPDKLHQKNERDQINYMKTLWLFFPEDAKPEWLAWEQILEYERQMCSGKQPGHSIRTSGLSPSVPDGTE